MNAVLKEKTMPHGYHSKRAQLARGLLEAGAVMVTESNHSPVRFSFHTPQSPKGGPMTPELVRLAVACMVHLQLAHKLECHGIVGVPNAGEPFAEEFSKLSGALRLQMYKWEQSDQNRIGRTRNLFSVPQTVRRIVVLDDLLGKGELKTEAVLNLREDGLEVDNVIVLLDLEQGGREELAKIDVTTHAVFTASDLFDDYVKKGSVSQYHRAKILKHLCHS